MNIEQILDRHARLNRGEVAQQIHKLLCKGLETSIYTRLLTWCMDQDYMSELTGLRPKFVHGVYRAQVSLYDGRN
mgnify:FL=1